MSFSCKLSLCGVLLVWIQCWCLVESTGCSAGLWGPYCQYQCMCSSSQEKCDTDPVKCVSGCKPGWTGAACNVFRCRYGDPVYTSTSSTCNDRSSNSSCPADYMCVQRGRSYSSNGGQSAWQGCCPKGEGPCHYEAQQITPFDAALDMIPPSCDRFGNYEAQQCGSMGPCTCVLPNGTNIQGTTHWRSSNTTNCTKSVSNYLKDKVCNMTGRWGVNCRHKCMCNDPSEQCNRLTGQCKYGCIPGYTGKACQEIFKCWFGEPVTRENNISCPYPDQITSQNVCPASHVCVVRRFVNRTKNVRDKWYGCCPKGQGPCDTRRQEIAPIDGEGDLIPPDCDWQGNYQPKQCGAFGCSCVLPNGTYIRDSHRTWKDSFKMNCTDVVKKHLLANPVIGTCTTPGKWGLNCTHKCICSDVNEQCDRLTGTCHKSGCRGGWTGPGCQDVFKCWFGKGINSSGCYDNHDYNTRDKQCPSDHICVKRYHYTEDRHVNGQWQGCCPKGKGPCDTRRQGITIIGGPTDIPIPECDANGNYKPRQCGMAGCHCVLPNGTMLEGYHEWDWETSKINCTKIVAQHLGDKLNDEPCPYIDEMDKKKWGPNCEHDCACSARYEQCDRQTGTCHKSGCREDRKGPGCQDRIKCFFGEAVEGPGCYDDIENKDSHCPKDYICVSRLYYMDNYENPWQGCCPKGKGPCETENQSIGPASPISDITIPECYENGYYKPKQCGMVGCSCVLPNGTYIEGTTTNWDDNPHDTDCESAVNKYLAGKCVGGACLTSPLLSSPKKKAALIVGLCAVGLVMIILIGGFAAHRIFVKTHKAVDQEKSKPYMFVEPVLTVNDIKEKNAI